MTAQPLQFNNDWHTETPEKIALLLQKLSYNVSAQPLPANNSMDLPAKSVEAIQNAYALDFIHKEGKY